MPPPESRFQGFATKYSSDSGACLQGPKESANWRDGDGSVPRSCGPRWRAGAQTLTASSSRSRCTARGLREGDWGGGVRVGGGGVPAICWGASRQLVGRGLPPEFFKVRISAHAGDYGELFAIKEAQPGLDGMVSKLQGWYGGLTSLPPLDLWIFGLAPTLLPIQAQGLDTPIPRQGHNPDSGQGPGTPLCSAVRAWGWSRSNLLAG